MVIALQERTQAPSPSGCNAPDALLKPCDGALLLLELARAGLQLRVQHLSLLHQLTLQGPHNMQRQ